jgi:hypothetical protein
LVYLGEQEDEEGEEEGKGLNRPARRKKTKAWACNQQTCRAKEDERMHCQTGKIESSTRIQGSIQVPIVKKMA